MGFKEQVQIDIDVFLNSDEFGDTHNIDGVDYDGVIVDDDAVMEYASKYPGMAKAEKVIHIGAVVLPGKPKKKQIMEFDNSTYRVLEVNDNDGIYTIILTANIGL